MRRQSPLWAMYLVNKAKFTHLSYSQVSGRMKCHVQRLGNSCSDKAAIKTKNYDRSIATANKEDITVSDIQILRDKLTCQSNRPSMHHGTCSLR